MSGAEFIKFASLISFALLSLAFLLTIIRIVRGPTLPDRVLALDLLVGIGIAYIAVGAIFTGYFLYLDIAISLGLVGFLATVAFARFILHRGKAIKNYENDVVVSKTTSKKKETTKTQAIKKEKTAGVSGTRAKRTTATNKKDKAKKTTPAKKKRAKKTT